MCGFAPRHANPPAPQLTEDEMDRGGFCRVRQDGSLPMGHAPDQWSYGDIDAGFKNAALILDETLLPPT